MSFAIYGGCHPCLGVLQEKNDNGEETPNTNVDHIIPTRDEDEDSIPDADDDSIPDADDDIELYDINVDDYPDDPDDDDDEPDDGDPFKHLSEFERQIVNDFR